MFFVFRLSCPAHLAAKAYAIRPLQALLRAGYRPTVYRSIVLQVGGLGTGAV